MVWNQLPVTSGLQFATPGPQAISRRRVRISRQRAPHELHGVTGQAQQSQTPNKSCSCAHNSYIPYYIVVVSIFCYPNTNPILPIYPYITPKPGGLRDLNGKSLRVEGEENIASRCCLMNCSLHRALSRPRRTRDGQKAIHTPMTWTVAIAMLCLNKVTASL